MRYFFIVILLILVNLSSKAQFSKPFVKNYTPKDYQAFFQNWDAVQDKKGVMYFANNYGVLVFSGNKWELVSAPNESIIRALEINDEGKVIVGGYNEIGTIESDNLGRPIFSSITQTLPEEYKDFGNVWNIVQLKDVTYFSTDKYILKYHDKKLTKVLDKGGKLFSKVNNAIYVSVDSSGLMQFKNDKIEKVPNGDFFNKMKVYAVVENRKGVMVITKGNGLYYYSPDTIYEMCDDKVQEILKQSDLYSAISLPDGNTCISTLKNGVIILNPVGEIVEIYNTESGVQNQTCWKTFFDKQGNLWLMLDKGITKIEYNSPFTVYNTTSGIEGTIMSITSFNQNLYIATSIGVYQSKQIHTSLGDKMEFFLLPDIKSQCWDLLEINNTLLIASSEGVFGINKQNKVTRFNNDIVYVFKKSEYYSNLLYTGKENGLSAVVFDHTWNEMDIPELNVQVRSIYEESEHNLWLGTYVNGAVNFIFDMSPEFKPTVSSVKEYSYNQGLKGAEVDIFNYDNQPIFSTDIGLMRKTIVADSLFFYPDTTLGKSFSNTTRIIFRLKEDHFHNVWMYAPLTGVINNEPLGFAKPYNNSFIYNYQQFNRLPSGIIYAIYPDNSSNVWLGGVEGLFKYNHSKNTIKYNAIFYTLLNKVTVAKDSLIYVGTCDLPKSISHLKYVNNSIEFEFSCTNFLNEERNQYQYKLDGFDDDWLDWSYENKKQYTNLYEGDYTFRVRSKNIFDDQGIEAVYQFTILPPWYRTWYAYLIYLILLGLFIFFIVRLSVYRLKMANLKLEDIIKTRTKEIREKNNLLSEALTDIKDSINYAKRLQEAILPKQAEIDKIFPDNFVMFMPRDIVSGDFYWVGVKNDIRIFIVADCTGHGVPGAFVSMLGNDLLNQIINEKGITQPFAILSLLNQGVQKAFKNDDLSINSNDGMDISIAVINNKNELVYAGANRPLLLLRNNEATELKPNKAAIGGRTAFDLCYEEEQVQLIDGDIIYMFSDGFADQFGGPLNKKFLLKHLKDLLAKNSSYSMEEQKEYLLKVFLDWKKDISQLDDVLVVGVKIKN